MNPHCIQQVMFFFDFSSLTSFGLLPLPLWKVLIDAGFAVLMWGLLLRFAVIALFSDNPPKRALLSYVQLTDIVIRLLRLITPAILTPAARSLYAAFLLFLLRYYGLPVLNNYPVDGLANLPFEDHLAAELSALSRLILGIGS